MENRKQQLLNLMIEEPLHFQQSHLLELVNLTGEEELTFNDLRQNLLRIYDMNEVNLQEASNPNMGSLRWPNKKSTAYRRKIYFKRIKKHITLNKDHRIIVAEGDSWFQFPFFITDIIDWLTKSENNAIYSIAAGGDWLANMIYEGKYIEELSIHKPHAFLISGGGNDFIGNNRIAVMVDKNAAYPKYATAAAIKDASFSQLSDEEINGFLEVQPFINREFYAYIWTLKTQYWILFRNLTNSGKFKNMRIITQGYDNVIPSSKYRWSWRAPHQYLVNWFVQTGQWLKQPLQIKGFNEGNTQRWLMRYLIFEVNQMFIELATAKKSNGDYVFPNLYHIDCRNVARSFNDWFDEIHLKSHRYKLIARAFEYVIAGRNSSDTAKKIIRAVEFDS